jgi:hypothetical protein
METEPDLGDSGTRGIALSRDLRESASGFSMVLGDDLITGHQMTIAEGSPPEIRKMAQNGNRGIIQAYSFSGPVPVTGLIGALLNIYFQIIEIRAWNLKSPIFQGEKPACLNLFGWRIPRKTIPAYRSVNLEKKPCFTIFAISPLPVVSG